MGDTLYEEIKLSRDDLERDKFVGYSDGKVATRTISTVVQPTGTNLHSVVDSGFLQIKDQYGFAAENTPMDEVRVAEATRLVGTIFEGTTIDTNFWTATLANNGTATQASNQITLGSSTANNGSSILQTTRKARYVASISNRFRAQVQLGDTGVTGNTRRWGCFDGTDGMYFELAGIVLSACVMKAGVRTLVLALNTPTTNITSYEIYYTNSKIYFVMGGVLVATHNATTATYSDTLTLPVRIDNINSGSTTNSTILVRVASITRLGKLETNPTYKNMTGISSSTILKYGAGMLHNIIVGTPVNNATIAVYDNTTGTANPISVFTLPNLASPMNIDFHCPFSNGLNIVPSSTGLNLTIVYE